VTDPHAARFSDAAELRAAALACRRGPRRVFAGLGFAVPAAGALLLRGPNGSGKSTLLRCLAGLLPADSGAVSWAGAPIAGDPDGHRRRLRYLGHQDAVKPQLTVAENLRFAAALSGAGRIDAGGALDAFGIAGLADLPARYLSAGQRRRLALARLVAAPAPLWLLDEPLAGLDDAAQALLAAALAAHRSQGGLAVLSVHGPFALAGAQTLDLAGFAARDLAPAGQATLP
jgi:heme exporter protein A